VTRLPAWLTAALAGAVLVGAAIAACSSGGSGTPSDAAGPACGAATCAATEVCVRTQFSGGACMMPGDAGCPAGTSFTGACCTQDPSWACAPLPSGCGGTPTCACAASTLCQPAYTCTTTGSSEIDCTLLAP
jgi:hypothetical protein